MKDGSNALTISVVEAGQRLGLSRNTAYEAARRGDIPVIRIGRLLRVPTMALDRMLKGDISAGTKAREVA